MFVVPNHKNGSKELENGSLVKLCSFCETNFIKKTCQKFYKKIDTVGIKTCPYGFSVYSFLHKDNFYHFSGLRSSKSDVIKLKKGSRLPEHHLGDQVLLDLEQLYRSNITSNDKIDDYRDFIHDARNINSQLKGQLEYIRENLSNHEGFDLSHFERRVTSSWHASQLLSVRMDYLKYKTNPKSVKLHDVNLHGKCIKAIKVLLPDAKLKQLDFCNDKIGSTFGSILGHDFIELIPLLLLENSIKYSPERGKVKLKIKENGNVIVLKISNYGPPISIEEISSLSKKRVRSKNAISYGFAGDGKGLAIVNDLCKLFDLRLKIETNDKESYINENKKYELFTITVSGSINQKDFYRDKIKKRQTNLF